MTRLASVVSVVVLGVALSACGGSSTTNASAKAPTTSKETTETAAATTTSEKSPNVTLAGMPALGSSMSALTAASAACSYQLWLTTLVSTGPSSNPRSLAYQVISVSATISEYAHVAASESSNYKKLSDDAVAESAYSNSPSINWNLPASFTSGKSYNAVGSDCDALGLPPAPKLGGNN